MRSTVFCSRTVVDKVCEFTSITDPALDIPPTFVPGREGLGILQPQEEVTVTQNDPGFANLNQPLWYDSLGNKMNIAEMVTVAAGSGTVERFTDEAIVSCQQEP